MSKLTDLLDTYIDGDIDIEELCRSLVGFTFSALPDRPATKYDTPEHIRASEEYWGGWPRENTAEELTQYWSRGKLNREDMSAIQKALLG